MLALPSAIAWLGWIGGLAALLAFAAITLYTSTLLACCYFVRGKRNRTVRAPQCCVGLPQGSA